MDFRHALPARHRRRLRRALALHRPGRGAVRCHAPSDPQRDRGRDRAPRPCRPVDVSHVRVDQRGAAPTGIKLWSDFERERPRILGALLDAMVVGMANRAKVKLATLPRMADFAIWSAACEPALWPAGTFGAAFDANRKELIEGVLDADAIATAIRGLMAAREAWVGTSSQLLHALEEVAGER